MGYMVEREPTDDSAGLSFRPCPADAPWVDGTSHVFSIGALAQGTRRETSEESKKNMFISHARYTGSFSALVHSSSREVSKEYTGMPAWWSSGGRVGSRWPSPPQRDVIPTRSTRAARFNAGGLDDPSDRSGAVPSGTRRPTRRMLRWPDGALTAGQGGHCASMRSLRRPARGIAIARSQVCRTFTQDGVHWPGDDPMRPCALTNADPRSPVRSRLCQVDRPTAIAS